MRKCIIGVVGPDGMVMSARVAGANVGATLDRQYGTRLKAAMLTSLGDVAHIGDSPIACVLGEDPEPVLMTRAAFERLHDAGVCEFHLFDSSGRWTHWTDETIDGLLMMIDED